MMERRVGAEDGLPRRPEAVLGGKARSPVRAAALQPVSWPMDWCLPGSIL